MRSSITILSGLAAALFASPAAADVVRAEDGHFITRAEAIVEATRKETWLALISPAGWWSGEHTWSADAANLTLTPQAGGCFCEKIPEVEDDDRITLEGSVEHMRVVQAYPEVALRMTGALGPLQSEPVNGVLTIAISDAEDGRGTRIVWEYNVGGRMRFPTDVISQAVDGVMTLQLSRLAQKLGAVEAPAQPGAAAPAGEEAPAESGSQAEPEGEADGSSVDDAFDDLSDD